MMTTWVSLGGSSPPILCDKPCPKISNWDAYRS
uniref:Uncharacterized protein n=1 Tax=virus sp. ctmTa7 TaxID=2828255 RepID=A0A8S5RBW8_9VIRU|nr:MAG TPA: hypothetical protein [virus sp. ctmTa7]